MSFNTIEKKEQTIAIKTAEVILENVLIRLSKNIILKFQKLDINNDAIKDAIVEIVKLTQAR